MLLAMLQDHIRLQVRGTSRGQTMLIATQLNERKMPKYSCDLRRSVAKPGLAAYHQLLLHRVSASPLNDADFPAPTSHPTQSLDYLSRPLRDRFLFDKFFGDD